VFGDRAQLVQRGTSIPLHQHPDTARFLDRFNIGIADAGGEGWMNPEK